MLLGVWHLNCALKDFEIVKGKPAPLDREQTSLNCEADSQ